MAITQMELRIYTKNDFTDKFILEFLKINKDISIKKYSEFLLSKKLSNDKATDIIAFLSNYDNGFFKPDKCNAYEPINKAFSSHDLGDPVSWLSQPGGAFYFKQTKGNKIEGVIENHRFAPIWEGKILMKPKVNEPLYLGEIRMFFEDKIFLMKETNYWAIVLKEICEIVGSSFGFIASEKANRSTNLNEFENGLNKEKILHRYNSR